MEVRGSLTNRRKRLPVRLRLCLGLFRQVVNQRLLVPELYDVIVPARCRCRVKKDKVVLLLKTGPPVVPFSAWQKLSSGAADPVEWGANPECVVL